MTTCLPTPTSQHTLTETNLAFAQRLAIHLWAAHSGDVQDRDLWRQRGVDAFRVAMRTFQVTPDFRSVCGPFITGVLLRQHDESTAGWLSASASA